MPDHIRSEPTIFQLSPEIFAEVLRDHLASARTNQSHKGLDKVGSLRAVVDDLNSSAMRAILRIVGKQPGQVLPFDLHPFLIRRSEYFVHMETVPIVIDRESITGTRGVIGSFVRRADFKNAMLPKISPADSARHSFPFTKDFVEACTVYCKGLAPT